MAAMCHLGDDPPGRSKVTPFLRHLRGQFRPTVCELYPRHPITKDSCILKASGDPWGTASAWSSRKKEKKKRLRWKSNKEDELLFLFCFGFFCFFYETSFAEKALGCRTLETSRSTGTGGLPGQTRREGGHFVKHKNIFLSLEPAAGGQQSANFSGRKQHFLSWHQTFSVQLSPLTPDVHHDAGVPRPVRPRGAPWQFSTRRPLRWSQVRSFSFPLFSSCFCALPLQPPTYLL